MQGQNGGAHGVHNGQRSSRVNDAANRPILITGGAGFIGTNLAHRLLSQGRTVLLFDNLSRSGVERNVRWLERVHRGRVKLIEGDIRDRQWVARAVEGVSQVFHLAAQVAVTTSIEDPRIDFDINVGGTINLLEALRACDPAPPLVYTSTNKVYGGLPDIDLQVCGQRYQPTDGEVLRNGIGESRPLDFHTPYGCSKGSAEQYVLDYARSFGMPACVFRMSCIYGPHQFGTEDQGWVAHFLIRALEGQPITLYGDGLQVRDILFVEDLVDAFVLAQQRIDRVSGQAFNIGGGPERTVSLLELLAIQQRLQGRMPDTIFQAPRAGDQRYYVSNTSKFRAATGWAPRMDPAGGIQVLQQWLQQSRNSVVDESIEVVMT